MWLSILRIYFALNKGEMVGYSHTTVWKMFPLIDPSTRKLLCEAVSSVVLQMLSNSAVHFCEKCFVRRNLMQEWMKEYFCVCALQIPPFQNCTLKPFLKPKLAGRCNILKEGRRNVTDPLQLLKKFSDFFSQYLSSSTVVIGRPYTTPGRGRGL